jgi:hypothetical protein
MGLLRYVTAAAAVAALKRVLEANSDARRRFARR